MGVAEPEVGLPAEDGRPQLRLEAQLEGGFRLLQGPGRVGRGEDLGVGRAIMGVGQDPSRPVRREGELDAAARLVELPEPDEVGGPRRGGSARSRARPRPRRERREA
ncbi:MAG: hypothetical protein MZV64_11040 [Ignavibacteriales bacterium]|nr:hypothetical protein [Ignavibacteriales bacterium]